MAEINWNELLWEEIAEFEDKKKQVIMFLSLQKLKEI